jgi:leucyl/phenylalanyl-tRNA--protein transferase
VPVFRLTDELAFPRPDVAEPGGLLAIGGDLRPERLLLAYAHGIFPWPHEGLPMLWFSPDPRMVLPVGALHVSRRLARTIRQGRFEVRLDTAFRDVVAGCATVDRPHDDGTWITAEIADAFAALHDLGFAHCAEAWRDGRLVGGIYGLALGGTFIGESMFARETDASKVAFATLVRQLERWRFDMLDAQVHTEHLARLGGREWPRARYLAALRRSVARPTRRGRWRLARDLAVVPGGGRFGSRSRRP